MVLPRFWTLQANGPRFWTLQANGLWFWTLQARLDGLLSGLRPHAAPGVDRGRLIDSVFQYDLSHLSFSGFMSRCR